MHKHLKDIFDGFDNCHILVVGDLMIDRYYWGNSTRMSPEAPVPVVDLDIVENRLGGAANVALNLHQLGAKVTICSVVGDDDEAKTMMQLLDVKGLAHHYLLKDSNRLTTVKTRVMNGKQQLLRIDRETKSDISALEELQLIQFITLQLQQHKVDALLLQDYNKGVLTARLIDEIILLCHKCQIPVAVDPKKNNFFAYKGATLFKPNLKEVSEALGEYIEKHDLRALNTAAEKLEQLLNAPFIIISLSEGGIFFYHQRKGEIIPAIPRKVIDVSGAGDTVICLATLALILKLDTKLMVQLANIAGGIACELEGVAALDKALLYAECNKILG